MAEYPNGEVKDNLCGLAITQYCQDCTDCLIKQVIEKCMVCSDGWSDWAIAEQVKASEILELFEIEEVNNNG
jgi:hypothetical protein